MVKKILNIIFWVAFVVLFVVWLVDFIMVKTEKDPIFCISKESIPYEDGTVNKCTGLGYKVIKYNRESIGEGYEFGPFWIQIREN